jgi:hypothetical protein
VPAPFLCVPLDEPISLKSSSWKRYTRRVRLNGNLRIWSRRSLLKRLWVTCFPLTSSYPEIEEREMVRESFWSAAPQREEGGSGGRKDVSRQPERGVIPPFIQRRGSREGSSMGGSHG